MEGGPAQLGCGSAGGAADFAQNRPQSQVEAQWADRFVDAEGQQVLGAPELQARTLKSASRFEVRALLLYVRLCRDADVRGGRWTGTRCRGAAQVALAEEMPRA